MKFTAAFGLACAAVAFVSAVPVTHDEIAAKSSKGLRLLKLEEDADPIWVTEDEKLDLLKAKKQFVRLFFFSVFYAGASSSHFSSSMSPILGNTKQAVSLRRRRKRKCRSRLVSLRNH
jgi:hypothetical protein